MVLARGATWGQPVDNFGQPVDNFGQPVDNFGQPVDNFCWCDGLTSVWTYVGPFGVTFVYTHVRN